MLVNNSVRMILLALGYCILAILASIGTFWYLVIFLLAVVRNTNTDQTAVGAVHRATISRSVVW